MPWK
jgi:hypothetical protein